MSPTAGAPRMWGRRRRAPRLLGVPLGALVALSLLLLAWEWMPPEPDAGLTSLLTSAAQRPCPQVEAIGLRGHGDPLDEWDGAGADVQALARLIQHRLQGVLTMELLGLPFSQGRDVLGLPLAVPRDVLTAARLLRTYVEHRARACPATRLVVIGQSQGAAIAHWAYPDIVHRIAAMVLLGDPLHLPSARYSVDLGNPHRGQLLLWLALDPFHLRVRDRIGADDSRVRSYCLPHDEVCGFDPFDRHPSTHMDYRHNPPAAEGGPGVLDRAADFVIGALSS